MLVKERMRREKIHHLPALDKDDRLAGIVTGAATPLALTIEDVRDA
jgi:CBS domain-containing protein